MAEHEIINITADSVFSEAVFLEAPVPPVPEDQDVDGAEAGETVREPSGFVLTAPPLPFSPSLRTTLLNWEWRTVWSEGEPKEPEESAPLEPSTETDALDRAERLKVAQEVYDRFLEFAGELLDGLKTESPPVLTELEKKMSAFVESITADPHGMIQVLGNVKFTENPRPSATSSIEHGVHTAIVALVIAVQAKMPASQMMELGLAALLHEMDMPWDLAEAFERGQRLPTESRKRLYSHPLLAYARLMALNFPAQVCRAVLEHHERFNGSGFPRQLADNKISVYARILAPACACFDRNGQPVKKDLRKTFHEVLKNSDGIHDGRVIKTFFYAVKPYL